MRKLLLAATVAAFAMASQANAQVIVDAPAINIANLKSLLQELRAYGTQLQQYLTEAQTYIQAFNIANGLVHNPSIGGVMALAGMTGFDLNSYLPVSPYALMGLTSGYSGAGIGGMMGKLTGLSSMVNTNFAVNNVHQCTTGTFACQLMTQKAYQAAGQTAIAQQAYTDLQNHMQVLQALRTRAGASPDAKDAADINNQIATETTYIQSLTAQLQAARAMASAQEQANNNRAAEFMQRDAEAAIAARRQ